MPVLLPRMLIVHAVNDLVALPRISARVFALQQEVKRERGQPADGDVCEDDPVPEAVPRLVDSAVDVRAHRAVDVAPPDCHRERRASLIGALNVAGDPRYGVGWRGTSV